MMVTEDYVSFEVAKLLKEKGFDEDIETLVTPQGDIYHLDENSVRHGRHLTIRNSVTNIYSEDVTCPTLQMAMKWIREQGFYIKVDIDVDYDEDERGTKWYREPAWDWVVFRIDERKQMSDDGALYATYEQAAEVAIKWCLENLF